MSVEAGTARKNGYYPTKPDGLARLVPETRQPFYLNQSPAFWRIISYQSCTRAMTRLRCLHCREQDMKNAIKVIDLQTGNIDASLL